MADTDEWGACCTRLSRCSLPVRHFVNLTMPVNLTPPHPSSLHPIAGVRIGVTSAGVRKVGRQDLTVVLLDEGAAVAGVFTQNRFCAAPVQVCREHLDAGTGVRAIVVNTGNANAGTGEEGLARARATCSALLLASVPAPSQRLSSRPTRTLPPMAADMAAIRSWCLPAPSTDHW